MADTPHPLHPPLHEVTDTDRAVAGPEQAAARRAAVHALEVAMVAHDRATMAHSRRVAELALAVGTRMGLSPEELEALELAALLHDVGKIGVDHSILYKGEALEDEEVAALRKHPLISAEIVGSLDGLEHIAPAVRAEHERWDGTGYPDGLKEEDIPQASRVIACCDAYDAITTAWPYRVALGDAEARLRLPEEAGRQFDPNAVKYLLQELAERSHAETGEPASAGSSARTA